jgi:alkylation response protein AidB-like acyl-CoA dehydrogenase
MGHYRSNIRDLKFDLFELLDRAATYGHAPFGELDAEAATSIIDEADRYARHKLAESFSDVGRERLAFDPDTHSVRLPKKFREAAVDYIESGWLDLEFPPTQGADEVPPSLRWSVTELMLGANPPIPMGINVVPQVVRLLLAKGTPAQQRLAELIREKRWMVTMVLTEPDAGSDVGAARTRAVQQPDGSWHLTGVKRFITYGDHDISDNIIHLVLARPSGVEGVGGPGTRGLSLFIVPKFVVDLETGDLTRRNGVNVTGIEHKLGIKVNPTCELTLGETEPAVGWLLGDSHEGISQMFEILKHFRMLVGVKSMATLSTGFLNAKDYAEARVQGAPLVPTSAGSEEPAVAIIDHPDVRRSLMAQKACAEGMRALVLYTATQQDALAVARFHGSGIEDPDSRHQLLLPVIKGYCSETAWRVLGQESLQIFGGSGFLEDYPLEQYVRDTKVDSLYEGTTGIQALDLLGRKIVRDGGEALQGLLRDIRSTAETGLSDFPGEAELLGVAVADFAHMVDILVGRWTSAAERELAAQDSTRLLLRMGDLVCGWLLLRSTALAATALNGSSNASSQLPDADFYRGKVATGRWFARTVLPGITADLRSVHLTDPELTKLPHSAF